jgi:uncharacterized protein YjbI with pentapeptide repeats
MGVDFSGTSFWGTTSGFTKEQLYSTASYQQKNLQGIGLGENDLTGWNFSGQNLTNADLRLSTLTNANLAGAVVTDAIFVAMRGFTKEQLYSTASYQQRNLQGIGLWNNDLAGWDFSGQVVTEAIFGPSITKEQLYSTASHQQRNLQGIGLWNNSLADWDFSSQNIQGANSTQLPATSKRICKQSVFGGKTSAVGISVGRTSLAHLCGNRCSRVPT